MALPLTADSENLLRAFGIHLSSFPFVLRPRDYPKALPFVNFPVQGNIAHKPARSHPNLGLKLKYLLRIAYSSASV
ncbi:uncharacterized protein ARMOST_12856 [Armillaria ostoyae]|uniref:Uncharacterized protein n=1 Tax=Armillaria ostoyae TaxID=47428 RepID=A0A284RL45_ARMOS|nr:uncharacterized protein ARMOST_12856 [Armillaria ostoyae]